MKFLTIEAIKKHVRVLGSAEDDVIEQIGSTSEEIVLDFIRQTYEELVAAHDGEVPARVYQACFLLCKDYYEHRGNVSQYTLDIVPYGNIEVLLKPLMIL